MIARIKKFLNYLKLNANSFRRKLRLRLTTSNSKIVHLSRTVSCLHKWYGSSYGGFYINPELLHEQSVVYSFGIGKDITFDMACIKKHKCRVYGFDPTPKSINYIKSIKSHPLFQFYPYGISTDTGYQKFFLPINKTHVSGSIIINETLNNENTIEVLMKSFKDITDELGHTKIDVLKMDIEGAEYTVLESIVNSKVAIDQILVEFHDRIDISGEPRSKKVVELLHEKGFEIFAVSLSYEEISFINKNIFNKSR